MRRVLRIWPAYYVAVALGFCLPLLGPRFIQLFGYGRSLEHPFFSQALPMFMLFLSNWTDLPVPSTLGRLWSVGVEEQFYILFPVSFAFATRRYPALRSIAFGLLIAWATRSYLALSGGERFIYLNTFAHGDHLLLGALLAQLLHARPRLLQGLVRRGGAPLEIGAVLSCVLLTAVVFPHEPKVLGWWLHYLVMALSTTAVVAVLGLGRGPIAHLLSFRFLRSLGGLTYGGYLFHMYAVVLAWAACSRVPLSPWPAATLRALVAVPLSYLIALGSKRLVEDPFLRLKSRFQARARG
jgi:peptidoglycan/LPS O-acetylase OafA/YrhL